MFFKFYMNAVVFIDLLNSNDSGSSAELAMDAVSINEKDKKIVRGSPVFFLISFSSVSVETQNDGINYHRLHSHHSLLFYSPSLFTVCLAFAFRFCIFCHYPFCQTFLMVGKSFFFFVLIYTFVDQRND